jgi:hypothetical protein
MPFEIVAVPHAAYAALPSSQHRWLLMCLARYADREGRCWPSMRQLAVDARMSLASVCRYLRSMADLGVFHRVRQGVGRYRYRLAEAYVPRWPGRVSRQQSDVLKGGNQKQTQQSTYRPTHKKHGEFQERYLHDDSSQWKARLWAWKDSGFWNPFWGPKPSEAGCWAPDVSRG